MSQAKELHRFQKYAEDILKKFNEYDTAIQNQSLLQEDRDLTKLRSQVETIRKQARDVKDSTSSEVKIAVMGEFNATKTTLLGSLLGYVGGLPESEVATTGNVTHLRIVQVQGSQPTQFQFTVEYLTLSEVNECLDFMVDRLAKKALEVRLSENLLSGLRSLTSTDANIWVNVINWYKEAKKSPDITPGFRHAMIELVVFAESYRRYGKVVCGTSPAIDKDTAHLGLQLPSDPKGILGIKFDQMPPNKQQLPEFLQATFPLIRRINVEVKVSDKIWNLSSLQGANKLVLLDFPGLGASKSDLRDRFLAVREMKNVQTILLLLDSTRPGSAKNYQIFDLLRQQRPNENIDDFILAGVGRFDNLPDAERCIDKLLKDDQPLTTQKVFQAIPALREAISSARESTKERDDRIVLLSAFAALEYGRKNLDNTIEIASPSTWEKLNEFQNSFPALNKKWQQLSEQLKKSQPQSILAIQLDAFTRDGGITQLRHLLESHVVNHGLDRLYQDARTKVKLLCVEQQRLQQMLDNSLMRELIASENPNLPILRQTLQKLADSYENLKNYLERNPLELGVKLSKTANEISLRQEVEDKVNYEIFGWSQWRNLLSQVDNGMINLEQKVQDEDDDDNQLGSLMPKEQNTICTVSNDFYAPFEGSCQKLVKYTIDRIDQTIEDWLNELSNEVVLLGETQMTIDIKLLRDEIDGCIQKTEINEKDTEKKTALRYVASPSEWKKFIVKKVEKNSLPPISFETLFPLPREDNSKSEPGLMFDWSPKKKRTNPIPENHLITILQLRDTMIANVSNKLVQLVTHKNQKITETLRKSSLENAIKALNNTLDDRDLLRQLVGEDKSEESPPDWLEILQEIANIRCPL